MGLTRRQRLWRVELPLAMPAIMAGIRIATVTIISLATVAAFIGVGGLGEPIFNAIQTGFKTQFIAAGVLAVLLALVDRCGARRRAAPAHAVDAGEGGLSVQSIIDAFQFIGDNFHFMLTKTLEHLALSGAAIAVSLLIAIPLGVTLGHQHTGLVPGHQRLEHRPRAAEPRDHLDRHRRPRHRLHQRHGRDGHPRRAADADQRVRRRRRGRPRCRRGRAGGRHERGAGAVEGRDAAGHRADVRRDTDRGGVRGGDGYARRDRGGRRSGRRDRQPGHLRHPGRDRRGADGDRAGLPGRGDPGGRPAHADPQGAAPRGGAGRPARAGHRRYAEQTRRRNRQCEAP